MYKNFIEARPNCPGQKWLERHRSWGHYSHNYNRHSIIAGGNFLYYLDGIFNAFIDVILLYRFMIYHDVFLTLLVVCVKRV